MYSPAFNSNMIQSNPLALDLSDTNVNTLVPSTINTSITPSPSDSNRIIASSSSPATHNSTYRPGNDTLDHLNRRVGSHKYSGENRNIILLY